jgi:solute carrier family 25 oxoglutarate transporter 11
MTSTSTSQQTLPQKSSMDLFLDKIQPFVIGGLSGMFATSIIQPVDMIKVSIQLKS